MIIYHSPSSVNKRTYGKFLRIPTARNSYRSNYAIVFERCTEPCDRCVGWVRLNKRNSVESTEPYEFATPTRTGMKEKRKTLKDVTNSTVKLKYPKEIENGYVTDDREIVGMVVSDEECGVFMYDEVSDGA